MELRLFGFTFPHSTLISTPTHLKAQLIEVFVSNKHPSSTSSLECYPSTAVEIRWNHFSRTIDMLCGIPQCWTTFVLISTIFIQHQLIGNIGFWDFHPSLCVEAVMFQYAYLGNLAITIIDYFWDGSCMWWWIWRSPGL